MPDTFSRRSFFLFLLLAPACFACVVAIILVMQYRQFQAMLSPAPDIPAFVWNPETVSSKDSVVASIAAFTAGRAGDTLRFSLADLNLLLASSPAVREQQMRFSMEVVDDSLLVLHSTQPVQAMQGRVAWVFRKLGKSGFLNARVEGWPKLENGRLELEPMRGFLNGQKIPRAALLTRGGFSPVDFLKEHDKYDALAGSLAKVTLQKGGVMLIRK